MKVLHYLNLIGAIALSIVTSNAFTQVLDQEKPVLMTSKARPVYVKKHLWEDFNASFKNTTDAKWFWTGKHYVVNFLIKDENHSAMFEPDGTLLHHLHFGSAKILSSEIRKLVRMGYPEYNITSAVVLTRGRRIAWFINLSDEHEVIEIRIDDRMVDELRRHTIKNTANPKFRQKNLIADH